MRSQRVRDDWATNTHTIRHSTWWHKRTQFLSISYLSHYFLKVKVKVLVTESCLTLCDHIDCSPPGFSVHGIIQARILELVAISFSKESSPPRDRIWVSYTADRLFTNWATMETKALTKSISYLSYYVLTLPIVGQDSATSLSLFTFLHWRRQW